MANPTQVDNLIRSKIPSWNQLFQNDSQCACDECESMTGAPAYLAHILYFAEHCNTNDKGESPYDVLIKRAPYLPFLPLTCKNTNTEMSYVRVVLEILEFFAAKKTIANMPAYDSGSIDWEADYLKISKKAYELLSKQCYPFTLPYHQPLDQIRTWLAKSKTSYRELLGLFNSKNATDGTYLVKEYLSLSDEEYSLLTEFKIGNDVIDVFKLYGFNDAATFQAALFGEHGISELLKRTGLQYIELIDILKTEFINPAIHSVNFIEDLFSGGTVSGKDLFTNLKAIKSSAVNDPNLEAKIQQLLSQSNQPGLSPNQFKNFLDDHFDDFQQTIIINPDPKDPCNFSIAKLSTIVSSNDAAIVNPVSDSDFKKLYFFIRLFKKTRWEIKTIDELLSPFSKSSNEDLLSLITFYYRVKEKYDVSPAQFISLAGTTNPLRPDSIYRQLFPLTTAKASNNGYGPDEFGSFFSNPVFLRAAAKYNAELLSALRISGNEMDSLTAFLGIGNPDTFRLSVEAVSAFHSYRLLSDVHSISISTLIGMIKTLGKTDALRTWDDVNKKFKDAKATSTLALMELANRIVDSGFTIEEIVHILGASNNDNDPVFQFPADKIKAMLTELQGEFMRIEAETSKVDDKDINEELVKNKLLTLYKKEIVSQAIGILNNKIVYAINLPAKPNLTIPDAFKSKVQYDQATGKLQVTGALTLADKNIFPANNELNTALKPIWDKSSEFLKEQFSSFITDDNTRNILLDRINNQTTPPSEKLKTFYNLYLPYLIKGLGQQSVREKIAGLISLDVNTTALITGPIIEDLYTKAQTITKQISSTTGYFPDNEVADLTKSLVSLSKGSLFISKFVLSGDEVEYFLAKPADFASIDFRNITVGQWQQVYDYCKLKKLNQSKEFSFIDLFELASSGASMETIVNFINLLTQWPKDEVNNMINAGSFNAASFKNESALLNMSSIFIVANRTSFKPSDLARWAQSDTTFDSLNKLAAEIKAEVLQQYISAARGETESNIGNEIMERQRNALVDHILCMDEIKNNQITTIDELCGYFLIDLPMSANMPTTRIRQAISTVQSFFKRCLMGLESIKEKVTKKEVGVAPSQIDNSIWEPKSFFRTWQVTMEFLTHPYPYLSYKYLIEKSEPAKTLEGTLLKSDITQRNVEDAYRVYLQEMAERANLEIATIFIDDTINIDNDPATKFIHVIAKSRSQPHKYYYCTKNESGRWSYLQHIPIAVKEDDGDGFGPGGSHLLFTKFRDRYYLFMPEFAKRQDKNTTVDSPEDLRKKSVNQFPVPVLWEVKIAVSELFQGKWTKKTYLSLKGPWSAFNKLNEADISSYRFSIEPDSLNGESLIINLASTSVLMTFNFYSPNAAVVFSQKKSWFYIPLPPGNYEQIKRNKWQQSIYKGDHDEIKDVFARNDSDLFFSFSPQYSLVKGFALNLQDPFFIHDANRTFYVTSHPFMHRETSSNVRTQPDKYGSAALIDVLKKPMDSIFIPLHVNAKN